jgi:hypothetical protein
MIVSVPDTDTRYYLISFDKHGMERDDDPHGVDGLLSESVRGVLADEPVTDVFLISHGWKGDVPAAKRQYNAWIGAMLACEADRQKIREKRPDFHPLLLGLHWPSLPYGEEDHEAEPVSFDPSDMGAMRDLMDDAADKTADTDRARAALRTIFVAAAENPEPATLPDEVRDAYQALWEEMALSADGPAGAPGADGEAFDPEAMYQRGREQDSGGVSFGAFDIKGGILTVLRQVSFWKMKKRAKDFGEGGAGRLLRTLQLDTEQKGVRFHLMGHSFGCIVMSGTIAGRDGHAPLPRPVSSAMLAQGALSLWSYCSEIPKHPGKRGYFRSIVEHEKVAGPVVTTLSIHDTAVGKLYPLAAGIAGQVTYAPGEKPQYGALGSWGAQGPGLDQENRSMLPETESYGFQPGRIYNLDSNDFINEGEGAGGAHNDIAKPAVAHAFWEVILSAP